MKKQSGSGLVFAVVLLFVILAMVVTLSSVTVLETKMSQKTKSSVGAFYNSESGVEWALNKIAVSTGPNISNVFGASFSDGKVACPAGFGCELYLLDEQGHVIASDTTIDQVKAVRSVGTQGGETQRAIEAAVAGSGSGCYVSYAAPPGPADPTGKCLQGFTNKGSVGQWGYCANPTSSATSLAYFLPPGGSCDNDPQSFTLNAHRYSEAFVCCL
jgi:hypothetical protein